MKPVKPKSAPMENENTKGILFDMSPRIQKQVRPKGKLGANIHCDSPRLEEIEPELIDFGERNSAFELKKIDVRIIPLKAALNYFFYFLIFRRNLISCS